MSSVNPWSEKARALDRYRWELLRQKHGVWDSAIRFLRDALQDFAFGICAYLRIGQQDVQTKCDFLLLQSAPKVIDFQRKKRLIQTLQARGHSLVETALDTPSRLLLSRRLFWPEQSVPIRYFGYAAHAQWLVRHYNPRIILNDRNGSYFLPFVRLTLETVNAKLVHLAHATTLEDSSRLSMNDYHYYFLFGRSSLDALRQRKIMFGTSTAVIAGSYMVDESFRFLPPDVKQKTVLVLGVGPDKEKLAGYQDTYTLLHDWAIINPDYRLIIKAHPRSKMELWSRLSHNVTNIEILSGSITLSEALARASIVVNIMSNAIIEAGFSGRPIVYVNCATEKDIFGQVRFFPGPIQNVSALSDAIESVERDYEMCCQRSREFSEYHLENGSKGLEVNVQILEHILQDIPLAMNTSVLNESWP